MAILPFHLHFYITNGNIKSMESQLPKKQVSKRKKDGFHHGDLKNSAIAATTQLIAKKGSVEFTIREVAKVIGVSHVALFNHFDDKSAILAEVAKNGFRGLSHSMRTIKTGKNSVLACAEAYVEFGLDHPSEFRAMFHPSIKPFTRFPELLSFATESFEILKAEVKKELLGESETECFAIWGAAHGLTSLILDNQFAGMLRADGSKSEGIAREAIRIIVEGILRRK